MSLEKLRTSAYVLGVQPIIWLVQKHEQQGTHQQKKHCQPALSTNVQPWPIQIFHCLLKQLTALKKEQLQHFHYQFHKSLTKLCTCLLVFHGCNIGLRHLTISPFCRIPSFFFSFQIWMHSHDQPIFRLLTRYCQRSKNCQHMLRQWQYVFL